MDQETKISRRAVLSGAAGACAFDIVPASVFAQPAPSDRIHFGHIGIGGRGSGFLRPESGGPTKPSPNLGGTGDRVLRSARSVALCDVDTSRLDKAASRVGGHPKLYKDFRRLLEDKDVDAVFIASPDHWHALMMIMACEAGKDVYVEKPACLTIEEGRAMVRAAERYGRVVQVGSQGRSQPAAWHACSYIRNGEIGTVRKVAAWHYASPTGDWTPDSAPPPELDYDAWLGPARYIPYNPKHTHGAFRWLLDFGGGQIRDRGAHVMSIAQWIMNSDAIGPVTIDGRGEPPHDGMYDTADKMNVTYEFKNPDWTLIWAQPGEPSAELEARYGAVYWGDKGRLTVTLGDGQNTATEEKAMKYQVPPGGVQVFRSPGHGENFEDCIKSREKPIMNIEAGVRVAHLCILGNLSFAMGRRFEWDPVNERILNDEEANRMLSRPGRASWHL
ncbi:MAG TPA: Gfo/Idh/MocA family oxidoreductase [Bryobacteraceae bacterium]|jgi:predicted dehydrogenase|nr:Gfo/Idh/MocA family oxidoreductase [Bryobacteraceae bacterium]